MLTLLITSQFDVLLNHVISYGFIYIRTRLYVVVEINISPSPYDFSPYIFVVNSLINIIN